jgi:2-oxoisovalerate dehydrogenase E2 component (dihydrolipoyl transacylase)
MSDIRTFRLPDLGEGLPDATIVEWLVPVGATLALDAPLISMETAKAIVEVPSPYSGKLIKVYGGNGEVIDTGAPLADFEIDAGATQRPEDAAPSPQNPSPGSAPTSGRLETMARLPADPPAGPGSHLHSAKEVGVQDAGTVVGAMQSSNRLVSESAVSIGGIKAMPAVRALARKLNVDLSIIIPSGADGIATLRDVQEAAQRPIVRFEPNASPLAPQAFGAHNAATESKPALAAQSGCASSPPAARVAVPEPSSALRNESPKPASGEPEQLKGVRRNMARVMADAQAKVALTTLFDDADIHAWQTGNDISVRLLRAMVAACKSVPACNAWFDGDALTRTLHSQVDVGIAVDTADGLFVPALRNADVLDAKQLRGALDDLLRQVHDRSIAPQELTGYTISLSNFGVFAGRYATPIVVPPCVAIVAAGKLRHAVVPVLGGVETHRLIPISLSFDHRAVTGGEAARFLQALLADLALGN